MTEVTHAWHSETDLVGIPHSRIVGIGRNPRNKCALQPGHSLMDWIRLGNSGKDLTGVGVQAGHLAITPTELAKHNKLSDAWLSIRGRVFNITAYLPFHPGGPEELMRGAGKDATSLFEEVHPWVNYESILQKCFVGHLVPLSPSKDAEKLFSAGVNSSSFKQKTIEVQTAVDDLLGIGDIEPTPIDEETRLPKFDWLQKTSEISIFFHTTPLANPLLEIKNQENTIGVNLCYENRTFMNELVFLKHVQWPCDIKLNHEAGKIECTLKKTVGEVWNNYGVLKQQSKVFASFSARNKISYVVHNKIQIASNVFLLELDRTDGVKMVVPIGYHVRVFLESEDKDFCRSYTPVPPSILSHMAPQKQNAGKLWLMVKRYPNGKMSKYVCDALKGDILKLSKPLFGGLLLSDLEKKEIFLMLAAGTGITPMLSLIIFLLERRVRKTQSVRLVFCNRKLKHIPFKQQFEDLSVSDSRFVVEHILSDPDEDWQGKKGHITKEIIQANIDAQLFGSNYPKLDLHVFICGPLPFNELCVELLTDLDIRKEQMHVFQG
ncbi:hypothetical protein HHI36_014725 [Cryptolaemus montrouzieri]|uniref:Cytochrome-b5 reductase n=1 Tax=Cryptolaemus montrouzieri TaxID=559131 RepID=A0ABD2N3J7_9CUCU